MGKVVHNDVLDAMLNEIATCTEIYLCVGEPVSRADADTKSVIPAHAMAGGDYTNADGDTSGRKVAVAAQNGLTADASGTVDHVALSDGTNLMYVTTCTPQAVTSGNTVNIGGWDIEVADPT